MKIKIHAIYRIAKNLFFILRIWNFLYFESFRDFKHLVFNI